MSLDGHLLGGVSVFSTVVECGSFARAGEALGISASGSATRLPGWRRAWECA
jgi:hypothetical protein